MRLRLDVTKPEDAKPGDQAPGHPADPRRRLGHRRQARAGPPAPQPPRRQRLGRRSTPTTGCRPRSASPSTSIDCKRAIAWWREHAEEHGGDPDFLCVTGGSAGGHLTALVGLTANDPRFQPGFEDVDTSVRAAVPFYGVYDFTNRLGTWHKDTVRRFFEPMVMQRKLADDPEAFAAYSPMDQVRADAPPFLVIHGSIDTLAPVEDAREFVRRLRETSEARCSTPRCRAPSTPSRSSRATAPHA